MIAARYLIWITNFVIGLIEFIIGLRILLKLLGAGAAPFVTWVYQTSQPLLNPFEGMFTTTKIATNVNYGSVLEFSALFAFLVYAFIGYLIGEALEYFTYRRRVYYSNDEEVEERRVKRRR